MKYLLITGAYRSGTSYLHKVFDSNPKCEVLFQPSIKYFKLIDAEIRKKLKKKLFKNFPLGIMKINKKISLKKIFILKKSLLTVTNKLIKSENKNLYYYKNIKKKIELEKDNINSEKLVNILFNSIKKTKMKKVIFGIKEPYLGNLLIPLSNLKNIFIINIIRDPREIVFSRNYSKIKNHPNFQNKKHPVILSSLLCLRNMEADTKLKKKKNYYSVKFRDLIYERKKIEKKLYKIFNIKFNLNLGNKWKINTSGLKVNYGSNWVKQMNKSDVAIIEKICGNKFKGYGFKKEIKRKNELNYLVNMFKENRKKILRWTDKNIFIKHDEKSLKNI